MMIFKVGDRVAHKEWGKGSIVVYNDETKMLVEFDTTNRGLHNGNGAGKTDRCWWCNENELNSSSLTFEPGKWYKFTAEKPSNGWVLDMELLFDRKPRLCTSVGEINKNPISETTVRVGFEGMESKWHYVPKDFTEVPAPVTNTTKGISIELTCTSQDIMQLLKVDTMELNEIKPMNLKEAKKQVTTERRNAEIEFAKREYRRLTDELDSLDRQIKEREVSRSKIVEALKPFKDN
jgi:hypothetical protein